MAFMTQHGLKLRLDIPFAFSLIYRIFAKNSKIGAYEVLRSCEGIYNIPNILAFFFGIYITIVPTATEYHLLFAYLLGAILGYALHIIGIFQLIPGLYTLSKFVGYYLYGYGLLLIAAIIISLILKGWMFALFWLIAFSIKFILFQIIEFFLTKFYLNHPSFGFVMSFPEMSFFRAYQHYAVKYELNIEPYVPDEEIESGNWQKVIDDYDNKYPKYAKKVLAFMYKF